MMITVSGKVRSTLFAVALVLCQLVASPGGALAQESVLTADADTLTAADLADLTNSTELAELPEPNPDAIAIEPVDLWDTGISPTKAVVMTPLFPGWGQLYARNSWQAALGFGSQMYFWTNMLVRDRRAVRANGFAETYPEGDINRQRYGAIAEENWEQMRDFAWWSGGVLLIIALDAYVGAHLFDFDEDPVPVPNRWDDAFGQVGDSMPGAGDSPTIVVFQWQKSF